MRTTTKLTLATIMAIAVSAGTVLGARLLSEPAHASEAPAEVPECVCSEPVGLGIAGGASISNCQCGALQCVLASFRDTGVSLVCPN